MSVSNLDLTKLGLTASEVEASRQQYGRNLLTPPQRPSALRLYLKTFSDPIIRILLAAAALSLIIGLMENGFVETIGIVAAIFLSTAIAFYFEYDARRKFDVLNALSQEEPVTVVRAGKVMQIPRSELVVGDVVILEQGAEVPADGLLIEAVGLTVNESALTGEPLCHKTTDAAHFVADATYPSNKLMRSSMILDGHAVMRIEAVGDATEVGHVAQQSAKQPHIETPLNIQLNRLASLINRIALVVSVLIFVICTIHGLTNYFSSLLPNESTDWLHVTHMVLNYFMVAVTLIVMAVPEGLPMAITLSLALNMRRMLRTNNLVRKLHACETMGAITVICTDKTGTLTQNRMEIAALNYRPEDFALLSENIATNTTAYLEDEGLTGIGNPTECALLQWLHKKGTDYAELRQKSIVEQQLSFSTERKYMATIVRSSTSGARMLFVKGAPEVILSHCRVDSDEAIEADVHLRQYQQAAMRTLAFACRPLAEDETGDCEALFKQGGLQFLGLSAIMDPVRPEVPSAVEKCHQAGIQVKIITGDHDGTAREIARRIGLWTGIDTDENAISGAEFSRLTDEEALRRIDSIKVMSRARPMDKQRFVELLQKRGYVVAVTGDGTNDAPALNHAQVGLSMGSGTSVAKEASDITLIDDSFRSIATAVMWGRSLYKNIQRFIAFQLTVNITALAITMIGALFQVELPLTVTQILWINLIMDTFAALALSTVPPSVDVMEEQPRRASDFIITPLLQRNIYGTAAFFFVILLGLLLYFGRWNSGVVSIQELTVFFTFFVLLQFWNILNVSTLGSRQSAFSRLGQNRGLLLVMFLILAGQILIVQFGDQVFRTTPLSLTTWLLLFVASSVILWAGELQRFLKRRRHTSLTRPS